MEISRLGINIQDSIMYIEYCCEEKDELPEVKKVELTEELLSENNVNQLIEYLKANNSNLFNGNFDFWEPKFKKLLSSINEYKTEKTLKSGTNKEIEAEKNKMDTTFERNKINPSDNNFIYDKRVDFQTKQNEELRNDWDDDNDDNEILDEDIAILDDDIEEDIDEDIDDDENIDNQFLQNMCADFTENHIANENKTTTTN